MSGRRHDGEVRVTSAAGLPCGERADAVESAVPTGRIKVAALTATPIKGLRVTSRPRVTLERGGVRHDRRFYLVDERGRMINGKLLGALIEVMADLDENGEQLTLTFPDGSVVAGTAEPGEVVETQFFSEQRQARVVRGPFSSVLSEHARQSLRLVQAADGSSAVDRGERGAVSMISRASLSSLAQEAGELDVDARRFRMSIEIDGADPFEEDHWLGRELLVGAARVVLRGHVGRCIVTSRNPETGEIDLPTLDHLRSLRAGARTSEPLALGVYGSVLQPRAVSVGDIVEVL
ncbi:MAG: MOSC N-terminal beta barrel domain-containing protein [Solirubrobacteraceae bacterium]|jgi:uncharacterized protein YcbX